MEGSLELQVRRLQAFYGSDRDPEGRGFLGLAEVQRRLGRPREALRILREGLRRHPDFASAYVVLGWVHLEEGEVREAEAAFQAALERDPKNVEALRCLGDRMEARGERALAMDCFRKVLELEPTDQVTRRRLDLLERSYSDTSAPASQPPSAEGEAGGRILWDDPEGAAEALDWSRACLQEDRSAGSPLPKALSGGSGPDRGGTDSAAREKEQEGEELWIPEEGVPLRPEEDDVLLTRTLGELYASQGLFQEAEEVFLRLLERETDPVLEARLAEVRALASGGLSGGLQGGVEESFRTPEEVPAPGPDEPEVIPVEALAPDVVVGVGELAPDRIVPVGELAPAWVVPVEALAPDVVVGVGELAPDRVVPVRELAPAGVVPVEALAPDLVVGVGELAPEEVVPIGDPSAGSRRPTKEEGGGREPASPARGELPGDDTLSATPPPRGSPQEPEEDPTLAAFEAWLKSLR